MPAHYRHPIMPDQAPDPANILLMECSLLISSFRWKLREAGYPFREPPNVDRTLARIDATCTPEPDLRRSQQRRDSKARARIAKTNAAVITG